MERTSVASRRLPLWILIVLSTALAWSATFTTPSASAGQATAPSDMQSVAGASRLACLVRADTPNVAFGLVAGNGSASCTTPFGITIGGCIQVNDGGWRDLNCVPQAGNGTGNVSTSFSASCLPNVTREYRGKVIVTEANPEVPGGYRYEAFSVPVLC